MLIRTKGKTCLGCIIGLTRLVIPTMKSQCLPDRRSQLLRDDSECRIMRDLRIVSEHQDD